MRPTFVDIGPFRYRIIWERYVKDVNAHGAVDETMELLSARADHFSLEIHVCDQMHVDVQRKSLLHEIIHACNWITGHGDASTEEQWVRSMAFPLLEVLRRNPRVTAFLLEH